MRHHSLATIFAGFVLFGIAKPGGVGILKSEDALAQAVPVAEMTPEELSFTQAAVCPGDFNNDGSVDLSDFPALASMFGTSSGEAGYDPRGDFDNDGSINLTDFLAFVEVFGTECESPPTPPQSEDREALVALYNATNGDNWRFNTNWLSNRPLGEWYGVTTDVDGQVTRLALYAVATSDGDTVGIGDGTGTYVGNRLTGSIPAALGSLSNVTSLSLSLNQLTGAIPGELGSLSNLTALFLNGNRLTGNIPAELGSLSNLKYLSLYGNQLTGAIPDELGSLSNLTALFLNSNRLTGGIPSALGNLTNLTQLRLNDNQLSGSVPDALGRLTNLRVLNLHNNTGLSGPFPDSFTRLDNLEDMLAHGTGLCLPEDEAFATWWVHRISNEKSAVSCAVLDERAALVALYDATDGPNWVFSTNWLSDRPLGEWYGVTTATSGRVTHLRLFTYDSNKPVTSTGTVSGNGLTGPLPAELGSLTKLIRLHLPNNRLTGRIPGKLGSMTKLEELELSNNRLTGRIPSELGSLTNLRVLSLSGNRLTGPIPSELGSLTNLQALSLSGNRLTGRIPSELGSVTKLEVLLLGANQLTGPIPSELGSLTSLETLELHESGLCAPTDAAFQAWLQGIEYRFGVVNCASGGGGDSPDLVADAASVSDASLTTGESFTLSATVRNQGNASAGSTTLRYYRSSNTTISDSDTEVGTDAVGALNASGTSAESIGLNAPSSAGTYYYGACVDAVSGESNTGNNCSSGVSVTVTASGGGGGGACTAGLVVRPGGRCTYKGYTFTVSSSGRGSIAFYNSGNSIDARGSTVNGVRWNFHASKNSGSNAWTIHTAD